MFVKPLYGAEGRSCSPQTHVEVLNALKNDRGGEEVVDAPGGVQG